MKSVSIRAGSGLGDSLYLQSIVRHLVEEGYHVEACTDWPDLFRPLRDRITVSPFRRHPADRIAHYVQGKNNPRTTQFEDMCIRAEVPRNIDLRLDWTIVNEVLARKIGKEKPVVAVQLPRRPMDRKDGFGAELLPNCAVLQAAIDIIKPHARIVQIGSGDAIHHFSGIDIDMSNRTSVSDLIDIASVVDGFLGYVSFFVPLAESLGKPALFVWSRRGLQSTTEFISAITPKKILHAVSSRAVVDDEELAGAVHEFLDAIRGPQAVRGPHGRDSRIRARSSQ